MHWTIQNERNSGLAIPLLELEEETRLIFMMLRKRCCRWNLLAQALLVYCKINSVIIISSLIMSCIQISRQKVS